MKHVGTVVLLMLSVAVAGTAIFVVTALVRDATTTGIIPAMA